MALSPALCDSVTIDRVDIQRERCARRPVAVAAAHHGEKKLSDR